MSTATREPRTRTRLLAMSVLGAAAALAGVTVSVSPAQADVVFGPDFEDYTAVELGTPQWRDPDTGAVANVPSPLGGLTLKAGDPDTLLVGGAANSPRGAIYAIPLERNAAGQITGFAGPGTFVSTAPNIDGGLAYVPGTETLMYTGFPVHTIGQILPGSTSPDRIDGGGGIDSTLFGIRRSVGALNFTPSFAPGAGALRVLSYQDSTFYTLPYAPSSTPGLLDLGPLASEGPRLSDGPDLEGIAYVPPGSSGFSSPGVLVSKFVSGVVEAYDVDAAGVPVADSARPFITNLRGAEGAFIDPVRGEFLFSTFGSGDQVVAVRGFSATAPPAAAADVSVEIAPPTVRATVGEEVTLDIDYANAGPSTATAGELVVELPARTAFVSAGDECSASARVVTCDLGDLRAETSDSVAVVLRATRAGDGVVSAEVGSSVVDPDPGDNTTTAAVQIAPRDTGAPEPPVAPQPADPDPSEMGSGTGTTTPVAARGSQLPMAGLPLSGATLLAALLATTVGAVVLRRRAGSVER